MGGHVIPVLVKIVKKLGAGWQAAKDEREGAGEDKRERVFHDRCYE